MDSSENASLHALTDEQIERPAAVVVDEFGPTLARTQFNDVILTLFEDIAGFETVPRDRMARYLKALWAMYRRSSTSSRTH